jgi:hypothetical protein
MNSIVLNYRFKKYLKRFGECQIRIICSEAGNFNRRNVLSYDDCRCPSVFYMAYVFSIGNKCKISRTRLINSCDFDNFDISFACKAAL